MRACVSMTTTILDTKAKEWNRYGLEHDMAFRLINRYFFHFQVMMASNHTMPAASCELPYYPADVVNGRPKKCDKTTQTRTSEPLRCLTDRKSKLLKRY